jgi:hypothetical protein
MGTHKVHSFCEISGSRGGENKYVFWDVAPCIIIEICWRFRSVYCLGRLGNRTFLYFHSYFSYKTSLKENVRDA